MRGPTRFVFMLASLAGGVQAQTEKAVRGQHGLTPYITNSEFRAATVTGEKQRIPLEKILTIPSLNTLTQYLGHPKEMSKDSPFGESVLAYVNYKGIELEYVKSQGTDFKLRELKITSPEWCITVNATPLRPGLDASSLNESVRRTGHMLIAAPGAARKAKSHGTLGVMEERSSIQIDFDDDTRQIIEVRFHQLL